MSDVMPDPKQSAGYKAARLAVIILSTLIILALIALVAGAIFKLGGKARTASGPAPDLATSLAPGATFALPPGAKLISMDSQPGRLVLRVRTPVGEEIDILDTGNGHLVSQIKLSSDK